MDPSLKTFMEVAGLIVAVSAVVKNSVIASRFITFLTELRPTIKGLLDGQCETERRFNAQDKVLSEQNKILSDIQKRLKELPEKHDP